MVVQVDMEFILEYDINIEQYVLCYLLHEDEQTRNTYIRTNLESFSDSPVTYLYKYFNKTNESESLEEWKRKDIQHLVDIDFLENNNPQDRWSADNMNVTQKFRDALFTSKLEFEQLLEVYPSQIVIDGKMARLKTIKNYRRLSERYNSFVKTKKLHRKIIELVKWAKTKDKIRMGVEKFVNSRLWEDLEKEYKKEGHVEDGESELRHY